MKMLLAAAALFCLAAATCATPKSAAKSAEPAQGTTANVGSTDPAPAADTASDTGPSGKRKPKASEVSNPSTR